MLASHKQSCLLLKKTFYNSRQSSNLFKQSFQYFYQNIFAEWRTLVHVEWRSSACCYAERHFADWCQAECRVENLLKASDAGTN
jgi:hypothetical protein